MNNWPKKKELKVSLGTEDMIPVQVDNTGAVMINGLTKLFEMFNVPKDAGLYICDQDDPKKIFVIKRDYEKQTK